MSKYINADDVGKLVHGISTALHGVLYDKEQDQTSKIKTADIDKLIKSYSYKNAIISGGIGLIPGPVGMIAAIPEIVAVIKNQIKMVADIANAYGQKADKELVMEILFGVAGSATIGLVAGAGQNIFVKKVGTKASKKAIEIFSKNILKQLLKSMSAKWIPVVGAVAMAAWSKYTTSKIGKRANDIFAAQSRVCVSKRKRRVYKDASLDKVAA